MKVGSTYSGFLLKKEKYVKEVKSLARVFEHKKTGARLVHLENDDDNKVFSIAFKTPAYDNTGLPHILEHSVLCGSKNFPTKDPFFELLKGSLQTFLNAMTYPDKTIYPVASKNEKDFQNLMNVYLDAVFYPKIYERPEILMQEGWRYHLEKTNGKLSINGVVYSEMKGNLSSPEMLIEKESIASVYSDTAHKFFFGGDPESIPNLTYEQFLEFHRNNYHPSNSYIYIYGDGDIKKCLNFLDTKYLSNFEKKKTPDLLGVQEPYKKMKVVRSKYSVSEDESVKGKAYFALNYACNEETTKLEKLALSILIYHLFSAKSAPLKRDLLKKGVGQEVFGHLEADVDPPYVAIWVKRADLKKETDFLKIVNTNLRHFVSKGLDKGSLEACLNIFEFNLRESDYGDTPKGLVYNLSILKNWLYGRDPLGPLSYEKAFKELRQVLKGDFFEKLLEKYLLKNTHSSLVVLEPEKGLLAKKEMQLEKELASFKKSLNTTELNRIVKQTLDFKKFQDTPASVEDVKKIPKLKLSDVDSKIEKILTKKEKILETVFLHNPLPTNGIVYLTLAFDTRVVPFEKLHPLKIFSLLLGKVATKKYTRDELDTVIQRDTGGCSFKQKTFLFKHDDRKYIPKLVCKGKVLNRKFLQLVGLFEEIMGESKFEDKAHVKEILQETCSRIETDIVLNGYALAFSRLQSYFSEQGKYVEYVDGLSFYHYLRDLIADFENRWAILKSDLEYLQSILFVRKDLVVNVVSEDGEYPKIKEILSKKLGKLKSFELKKHEHKFDVEYVNEGLLTQNAMQSVVQGNNFKSLGYEFSGQMLVLGHIVSREYLHDQVRVRGGAYGADCAFGKGGNALFFSVEDPEIVRTLKVFREIPKFVENFKTENMDKFVLGVIGALDTPLTFSMKGGKSLAMEISGIAWKDLQKERDEVLATTQKDIRGFAGLLRALFEEECFCVLGNEGKIKTARKTFERLVLVSN